MITKNWLNSVTLAGDNAVLYQIHSCLMNFFNTIFSFLKDKAYRDLLLTTILVLSVGTVVYHFLEGWNWLDSVYFSIITLTTIGYGDFSPQTTGGKIFTMAYVLVGVGLILSFINTVYHHYSDAWLKKREEERKSDKLL